MIYPHPCLKHFLCTALRFQHHKMGRGYPMAFQTSLHIPQKSGDTGETYPSTQHQHPVCDYSYGLPIERFHIWRGQFRSLCSSHHPARQGQILPQNRQRLEWIVLSHSPAAGKQLQHHLYPSCHHILFPTAGHKKLQLSHCNDLVHSLTAMELFLVYLKKKTKGRNIC